LRNIFSISAAKNYFFETMPSMANPLGIGQRAMPLVCKVQNLLIADFLNYLALRHNVYLSTMSELLKKKPSITPSATAES
ncbi:MAG: M23 family peptidase, partial [Acinetobacter sp.]